MLRTSGFQDAETDMLALVYCAWLVACGSWFVAWLVRQACSPPAASLPTRSQVLAAKEFRGTGSEVKLKIAW